MKRFIFISMFLAFFASFFPQEIFNSPFNNEVVEHDISEYINLLDGKIITTKECKIETIERQNENFHVYIRYMDESLLITNIKKIEVQVGLQYQPGEIIGEIDTEYILVCLSEKMFQYLKVNSFNSFSVACPIGTNFYANADGFVTEAKYDIEYGCYINVEYSNYKVRYSHLQTYGVMKGNELKKGLILGTTGFTGNIKDSCLGITFLDFVGSMIFFITE